MSAKQDEFFVTLSSDGSSSYQDNKPGNFQIQLDNAIQLNSGDWKVGLLAVQYPRMINNFGLDTYIKLWNGSNEDIHYFPNTHFSKADDLSAYLTKTFKRKPFVFPQYDVNSTKNILSTNFVKSFNLSTIDDTLFRHFNLTHLSPEAKEDIFTNTKPLFDRRILPILSDEDKLELTRLDKIDRDILRAVTNNELEKLQPNPENNVRKALHIFYSLFQPSLTEIKDLNDFTVNETQSKIKATINTEGYFSIESNTSEFDIGISPTLRYILGYSNKSNYTIENYDKRRFFHTYLRYVAKNNLFLTGTFFTVLCKILYSERVELERLLKSSGNKAKLLASYKRVYRTILSELLNIECEHVWDDFTRYVDPENTTIDNSPNTLIFGSHWPQNSPWEKYFNNEKFYKHVAYMEQKTPSDQYDYNKKTFTDIEGHHLRYRFKIRGEIIASYMLYTLAEEMFQNTNQFPQGVEMLAPADVTPIISYPNSCLYIYTDIIEPNYFNESRSRLLAIVESRVNDSRVDYIRQEINNVQYKPLIVGLKTLSIIHIYIYSLLGAPINLQTGPLFIQLHFIRERSI